MNAYGWIAWENMTPRCCCPFPEETWLAKHWLAGWDAAEEVHESLVNAKPIQAEVDGSAVAKPKDTVLTGTQVREARRLLGWSADRLGGRCDISGTVISIFERTGKIMVHMAQLGAEPDPGERIRVLRSVLQEAGILFTSKGTPGVRLRNVQQVTGDQVSEARRLLGWTIERLGSLCDIPASALRNFERTNRLPRPNVVESSSTHIAARFIAIRTTLEAAGIVFMDGGEPGVKLRKEER